jgi:hypothetical protein
MGKSPPSLLSRVPRRGQEYLQVILTERGGDLPLEQYLAARWREMQETRARSESDPFTAARVEEASRGLLLAGGMSSRELVWFGFTLLGLAYHLKGVAIARRFALDDPSELGRGLAVLNRLREIGERLDSPSLRAGFEYDRQLEACALHDFHLAREYTLGQRPGRHAIPDNYELADVGVTSILQRNDATLEVAVAEMSRRKVRPWMQGIYACVAGIAARNPAKLQAGLRLHLDGMRALRQKDDLDEAIVLNAHGLYRLAEWVSPELVAGCDLELPLPWDGAFHAWCEANLKPLTSLDLTFISPEIHEAIVNGPPTWLQRRREPLWEVVVTHVNPRNPDEMEAVRQFSGGTLAELKPRLAHGPYVVCWNLAQAHVDAILGRLEAAGVSGEARLMSEWSDGESEGRSEDARLGPENERPSV